MAITIIGPDSTPQSRVAGFPVVEIRRLWNDSPTTEGWYVDPSIELVSAKVATCGQEIGTLVFDRRYGEVKPPYRTAEANVDEPALRPVNWLGYWARVLFQTATGPELAWMGRVGSETREVYGSGDAAAGKQTFVAYEPAQYLDNIIVSESYWLRPKRDDEDQDANVPTGYVEQRLGWMPGVNSRDDGDFLVGNMIAFDDSFEGHPRRRAWFGGSTNWNFADLVEYLLSRFVDASTVGGPVWTLAGQVDLLRGIESTMKFNRSESVLSMLRKVVNPKWGLDFVIRPAGTTDADPDNGFQVEVFSLNAEERTFAGATIPVNPKRVEIKASTDRYVEAVKIARGSEHTVGRIRVLGRRLVCCTTLYNPGPEPPVDPEAPDNNTLKGKWSTELETAYDAGTGTPTDDPVDHDKARRADRFRSVYAMFGAPAAWNRIGGATAPIQIIDGEVHTLAQMSVAAPVYQNKVRKTLSFIPFQEGIDYSVDPPKDNRTFDEAAETEFVPPLFILWDESDDTDVEGYIKADDVGMSHSALQQEWGMHVRGSPNHKLALNHFDPAGPSEAGSDTEPIYDWAKSLMTIAFEIDSRLEVKFERAGGVRPQDGTLDIVDEDAELWYATPGTVFGLDDKGQPRRTPVDTFLILRNDASRLFAMLAGAIARYFYPRSRAEVKYRGLFPFSTLTGQLLTVIETSGDSRSINGPITSVEYFFGDQPRTIIHAGYAR